jgi:hypothetical protein
VTNISRIRTVWTGFPGAPGVSTFYAKEPVGMVTALNTFWNVTKPLLPIDVTVTTLNTGDVIEDTTGDLVLSWSGGALLAQVGEVSSVYAAPCGAVVNWLSDVIADSHRVRGKTFVVPLIAGAYDESGSLTPATLTLLRANAAALVASQAANFVVWHRPFLGSPAVGSRPARPAHAGGHADVTASSVPDKSVVLRSRRD